MAGPHLGMYYLGVTANPPFKEDADGEDIGRNRDCLSNY
jgi:hypothetical protein